MNKTMASILLGFGLAFTSCSLNTKSESLPGSHSVTGGQNSPTLSGGCAENSMKKKYDWIPSLSAPKEYPIQVIDGHFSNADGTSTTLRGGKMIFNGWGRMGVIDISGPDQKAAPRELRVKWYSFMEDIFYEGVFQLPQADIAHHFARPVLTNSGIETFSWLSVGLAPGGHVVVWVNVNNVQHEVATYSASPVYMDWKSFFPREDMTRREYREIKMLEVMKEDVMRPLIDLVEHEAPWATRYARRFGWQFDSQASINPDSVEVSYFNGEREHIEAGHNSVLYIEDRGAPKQLHIYWKTETEQFRGSVVFDEHEVFNALEELFGHDHRPIMLRLQLDAGGSRILVDMHAGDHRVNLSAGRVSRQPL